MTDEGSFSRLLKETGEWEECGRRLTELLEDMKEKTGDAALYVDEDGEVFMHPELVEKLNEPGNEGPLEFLRYMKRTGMTKEQG